MWGLKKSYEGLIECFTCLRVNQFSQSYPAGLGCEAGIVDYSSRDLQRGGTTQANHSERSSARRS